MKNLLPGKIEWAILVIAAVTCTVVVAMSPVFDLTMAGVAVPLFLACALMGMRRNVRLAEIQETNRSQQEARRDA